MKFHVLAAAAALTLTSAAPGFAATVIANGTFEDTSGWSGSFSPQGGPAGGFPTLDTQLYYSGGNTSFNEITQTYSLSAGEIASLQTTGLDFVMSADLFGFSSQNDFSTFTAEFLDGTTASLGSVSLTSTTNDPGTWAASNTSGADPIFQSVSGSLSALTESILFSVSSTRVTGLSNDGYLDNAFFELSETAGPVSPVPLPAGLPLLLLGLGALGVMRKRT